MNGKMLFEGKRGLAILALGVLAAARGWAHDADTLAFYPFTEGAAGETANGKTIANDANANHSGTVTVATDAGMVYNSDIPGKYILASSFAATNEPTILFTNPQSVHFTGSGTIAFESLSSSMSANDDYTVEFFYKIQEEDKRGADVIWSTFLQYDVGTVYNGINESYTTGACYSRIGTRRCN